MTGKLRRIYDAVLAGHLARYRQMAFVTGPRQVGKTTTCRGLGTAYLNWEFPGDRKIINAGHDALAGRLGLDRIGRGRIVAVFDELHKWGKWKHFLKGFFDAFEDRARIVVTGSSRLDVYRRGGDSLMGRYFLFRMHPFSVAEIARQSPSRDAIRPPANIPDAEYRALLEHGGYPEPFIRRNRGFSLRWHRMRMHQLFRGDLRDLTRIQELGQVEALAGLLGDRSGSRLVFGNLAADLSVSIHSIKRWVDALAGLHHGFLIRPWHKRVTRSLVKEPKWYLRDWAGVRDPGARAETFIACHLLKAVEGWTDLGLGEYGLYYLRDKQQREVDFLVVRDGKPWFMVEAKKGDADLNPSLGYFKEMTGATHAFQAAVDAPYVGADCFERKDPVRVPARTLLSQLF